MMAHNKLPKKKVKIANISSFAKPLKSMMMEWAMGLEALVQECNEVVGLPGFEPGSIAPKATSIDQTNPQALTKSD
tara:strand:- start:139 stop:366 length:228 start_codon:yes stop_codon:yes gene_type:complete